jgi:hypothetical protein
LSAQHLIILGMETEQPDCTPFDDAWVVLLSSKALQQDLPSVCKLLCCSHGMAEVVHRTCTGSLNVNFKLFPPEHHLVLAKWLLQHAKLLRYLEVEISSSNAEHSIAAALAAASGTVLSVCPHTEIAAEAHIAASAGIYSAAGPLPLQKLVIHGACSSGSILHALRGSPLLSWLEMKFAADLSAQQLQAAASAVAKMKALQALIITQGEGVLGGGRWGVW